MSEVQIVLAFIDFLSMMAHWIQEHLLLSAETWQARARYQKFVMWMLSSAGVDQATARLLSCLRHEAWDAVLADLRELLGIVHYEEVGQLLAAGAQPFEHLKRQHQLAPQEPASVLSPRGTSEGSRDNIHVELL
jgi:hypothetical protein